MRVNLKILGMALLAIILASCKKEKMENLNAFDDAVNSELEFRDFEEDELGIQTCNTDFLANLSDGAVVIDTMESYPKTIIIDYGEGVEDSWGRVKYGQVILEITNDMSVEGAVKTMTFNQFKVNTVSIQGYRVITNLGKNQDENIEFSIEGELILDKNGISITRTFVRKRTWIEGYETCEKNDDLFLISGSATLEKDSKTILKVITIPIKINPSGCKYPLEGEVSIEKSNGKTGVLNFGSGECDSEAILTLDNGEVKTVDLERRRCRR
tara:strand:- start:336 stop:1142 length:807 start_codon:yes stop_codon:yes gene_type:complete